MSNDVEKSSLIEVMLNCLYLETCVLIIQLGYRKIFRFISVYVDLENLIFR